MEKYKTKTGEVTELSNFKTKGEVFKVDGVNVLQDHEENEKSTAKFLIEKYGGNIELVQRILKPEGIRTPDYIWDGIKWDRKGLTGKSNQVIKYAIRDCEEQANNFIIDVTDCPLSENELYIQTKKLYGSGDAKFVDKIVLIKNNKVLGIFERI